MQLSRQEVCRVWADDRRKERRSLIITIIVAVILFLFCLSWRYNAAYWSEQFVPAQYFKSYCLVIKNLFFSLFKSSEGYLNVRQEIAEMDSVIYLGAIARAKITFMSFLGGAGISVAGAIFQTAYRNPMASPNILGAGVGVRLGNVLVITLYSVQAAANIYLRYEFCYALTIICVGAVFLIGKILSPKKKQEFSIMEVIMMGSIISQGLNILNIYLMYELSEEDMLVLQQLQMGVNLNLDWVSLGIFFGVMLICIIPVVAMRYRINSISMSAQETASMGVSSNALSVVCQISGVVMVTCAAIHLGDAGMISMVVPYVVRRAVGSDFKRVCVYSIIIGGCVMMVSRMIAGLILIADEPLPVTFVLNLLLMPVFMIITAKRRKEQQV